MFSFSLVFPRRNGIHHTFFCSVTSGSGDRLREEGCHGGGVYSFSLAMSTGGFLGHPGMEEEGVITNIKESFPDLPFLVLLSVANGWIPKLTFSRAPGKKDFPFFLWGDPAQNRPQNPALAGCLFSTRKSRSEVPGRGEFWEENCLGKGGVDRAKKGKKDAQKKVGKGVFGRCTFTPVSGVKVHLPHAILPLRRAQARGGCTFIPKRG